MNTTTQPQTNGPGAGSAPLALVQQPDGAMAEVLDRLSDRYRLALEPRNLDEGYEIAESAAAAGLAPTADEAYARILIGRPLGIPAMASIQGIVLVENKSGGKTVCMYAKLKLALLQSRKDVIEYIRPKKLTNEEAIFVGKRRDDPEQLEYKFSIEDARIAGLVGRGESFQQRSDGQKISMSNYDRHPGPMLQWRSCGRLCDIIGADILAGIATREEVEDDARIARLELEERAAAAGRGETPKLDAPPQAKPAVTVARDFRKEADALKVELTSAIEAQSKPKMEAFRKAYNAFKAEAPAELSEEIQTFYSTEVGKARKAARPDGAATGAPPVPRQQPAAVQPAPQFAEPPPDAGDAWEPPRDPKAPPFR